MNYNNSVIVFLVTLFYHEVCCIVLKYKPNVGVISKLRSLDDTRYRQSKQLEITEIPKNGNIHEENHNYADNIMIKEKKSKYTQKLSIDLPAEDDSKKNRLPEVNLKDLINSQEVPNDESVEDFVDLSFEQTDSADKEDKISQNKYENIKYYNHYNKRKTRAKRLATAANYGRYKTRDIKGVLKWMTKRLNNNLKKSRWKRNSNIIDEENLVTTISIFKFTGRPSHINEHLAFKNIHP